MGSTHPGAEKKHEKKGAAKSYGLIRTPTPHPSVLLRRREKSHERGSEVEPGKKCVCRGVYSFVLVSYHPLLFLTGNKLN